MTDTETQQERVYFTEAFCFGLALELHARTGWPLWVLHDPEIGDGVHALVRRPDGQFVDIDGVQTQAQVKAEWPEGWLRTVSPRYFDDWDTYDPELGVLCPFRVAVAAERLLALAA
jgi:hypothetical protein